MKFKKIVVIVLIVSLFVGHPTPTHAAAAWGTLNIVGDMLKQMMEEISEQIKIGFNSSAKMSAVKQATSMIESALYGDSSSPRNINNYYDFMVTDPTEEAITYTEAFLTDVLRGTASGDYTSSGGGGDLGSILKSAGQGVIDDLEGKIDRTADYADYCSGTDFFADGNYQCFSAIMANPLNTPIGVALATDAVATAKYTEEQLKQQIIATSTGTLPDIDEYGNVRLPSSIVEEIQLQRITLPLEALANGDSGVFSSAIQAFAVRLIVDVMKDGVSETENSMDKNTDAFEKEYGEWTNPDTGQIYTGS